jgi:hypothetical protein
LELGIANMMEFANQWQKLAWRFSKYQGILVSYIQTHVELFMVN